MKFFRSIQDATRLAVERPYALMVLQSQILYDLASMLETLLNKIEEMRRNVVPSGEVMPFEVSVNRDEREIRPGGFWRGISVYNRGPSACYVQLSRKMLGYKPVKLNPGASKTWIFIAPVIEAIYAKSEGHSTLEVEFTR